jgi:hypothetical protein
MNDVKRGGIPKFGTPPLFLSERLLVHSIARLRQPIGQYPLGTFLNPNGKVNNGDRFIHLRNQTPDKVRRLFGRKSEGKRGGCLFRSGDDQHVPETVFGVAFFAGGRRVILATNA